MPSTLGNKSRKDCKEKQKTGSFWSSKLPYPGFGLNAQVHQDGEESQGGDGSSPRKQVDIRVSIGLGGAWRRGKGAERISTACRMHRRGIKRGRLKANSQSKE